MVWARDDAGSSIPVGMRGGGGSSAASAGQMDKSWLPLVAHGVAAFGGSSRSRGSSSRSAPMSWWRAATPRPPARRARSLAPLPACFLVCLPLAPVLACSPTAERRHACSRPRAPVDDGWWVLPAAALPPSSLSLCSLSPSHPLCQPLIDSSCMWRGLRGGQVAMAAGRQSGVSITCDLAPTTAAGRNGRGKACSINQLLVSSPPTPLPTPPFLSLHSNCGGQGKAADH